MGSLYLKGKKLWARYKNERGEWAGAPTPYRPGEETKAQRFLSELEATVPAKVEAKSQMDLAPGEPITVARYADRWMAGRRKIGLATADDDASRLRLHALPIIGTLKLEEVRPRHVRDLVLQLRAAAQLAPRSIRHVYATLATMFRTAVADELILATPCVLPRGFLPKSIDADPSFRANAIFTREEVEGLISDPRILQDRRVLHALKGLAGLRHGEAARLRWRNYDSTLDPLGALDLERTKTQVPRRVPVHPNMAGRPPPRT
jgi:integrase